MSKTTKTKPTAQPVRQYGHVKSSFTEAVRFGITPDMRAALEEIARAEDRSLSQMARRLLQAGIDAYHA